MDSKDIFTLYGSDDVQYKKYDKGEAAEIIIPTEINISVRNKQPEPEKLSPALSFINSFLDFAESLGEMYIRLFKGIILKILPIFVFAFRLTKKLFSLFAKIPASFKDKNIRSKLSGNKSISHDIKAIRLQTLKQEEENKTSFFLRALRNYFAEYFKEDDSLLKGAFSYALPLAVLAIICFGLYSYNSNVPALKIMLRGNTIAYPENHSIWTEGKNKALSMIYADGDSADFLGDITFEMERVNVNKLCSADVISENLLADSSTEYKRACGIYIDGKLLCATHNESDALGVLDSILAPYEAKAGDDTIVGFVEEIEYIQGYYPENSDIIWDSSKLLETLQSDKSPVRVKTMKTVTRYETIKFDTVKRKTSALYKGTKKTLQKGKNGKMQITELVTYIDSVKTYTATVSEKVVVAPTDEIVQVGTKTSNYGGSYGSSTGFIWPTRGAYRVSSYYGYRSASISGWSYHGGIDIVLGSGSSAGIPVVASASGTVVVANSGWRGYGHTVVIDHGNGIRTRYAHMYPGSITVRVGQRVYQGQQIGRIGSTGNSTGPHLHFEMLINGRKVNPYPYIR
ncbi:MAG: M23 family metallopeptidase [Clostridia bacterium]|nr:M23 family metallopeptidase [Clostridia bacterium]